jgi:hypothetical protein
MRMAMAYYKYITQIIIIGIIYPINYSLILASTQYAFDHQKAIAMIVS